MIAIVHSIYSQSVHAPARDAGLMDNDAERYCICVHVQYYGSKRPAIYSKLRFEINFFEIALSLHKE